MDIMTQLELGLAVDMGVGDILGLTWRAIDSLLSEDHTCKLDR